MSFIETLVSRVRTEWEWFGSDRTSEDHFIDPKGNTTFEDGKGGKRYPRKETVKPYSDRIGDYWLSISSKDYDRLVKAYAASYGKLDGTVNLAWSAAFVSYCMQMAGAGKAFPYAPGHATWIVRSILAKKKGLLDAPLVGYRTSEEAVRIGDLVGRAREKGVDYDTAVKVGWFESHTDVVVEIDRANRRALVIGGNVGQTVSEVEIALTASGTIAEDRYMVLIRNNISLPEPVAAAATVSLFETMVG